MELWRILLGIFILVFIVCGFIFVVFSAKPMSESIKFSRLEFKRIMDKVLKDKR